MAFLSEKLISASGGVQEETDDDFNLVTGLYHFDGSNGAQNNTFTGVGASGASQSWTRNGSPTQGTFSPFSAEEGKWSVEFDGTDDYLYLPDDNDFNFGSNDWTIEAFVNVNAIDTNYKCIFSRSYGLQFYVYDDKLHLAVNDTNNTSGWMIASFSTAGQIPSAGVWHHVAAYRDGSNFYCSVDGVVSSMGSSSATIATRLDTAQHYNPKIGVWANNTLPMNGYISNLRIINGTALYGSSNFTAPSSPLTVVTNTKLLTCCSNRFRDKSTAAHAVTPSSVPKVRPSSPFLPSEEYDASTMGGSGHFVRGNTSDSISFSDSSLAIGTSDFTIEGWYYFDGNYNDSMGLFQQDDGVKGPAIGWWPANSNGWQLYYGSSYVGTTESGIRMFEWIHVAFVRSSGTIKVYVNGINSAIQSDTTNYTSTNFKIGQYYSSFYGMEGYISNFKMCLNAIYTSNFTPPTALVTPTSGGSTAASTKILVNFTNAAIIDSSRKTNVLTVGNAQLDTSVKKFGTASAEFDHTGDYLKISRSSFIPIGLGDFTIECFVYHTSTPNGNGQGYFQLSNGYLNSQVRGPAAGAEGNNGKWTMFAGTTQYTHTGLPQINTWYHVAQVRNSGTTKLYVDGTEYLSASDTTNYTDTYFLIGGWYSTAYLMDGYIDEFRISLKARYTSNFTAPTKAFPNL